MDFKNKKTKKGIKIIYTITNKEISVFNGTGLIEDLIKTYISKTLGDEKNG